MIIIILLLSVANLVVIGAFAILIMKRMGENTEAIQNDILQLTEEVKKTTVVVEEANEDMALQVAELRTLSDGMRLDTAGVKGAFLVAASRIAAISDAACGKLPDWIKEKTSVGKVLDVENSATGERLEFDYLENGNIKSRTFRGDVLVCEILHDSNGGIMEGIVYSQEGKPQKRFVYDAMGQVKEQEEVEG